MSDPSCWCIAHSEVAHGHMYGSGLAPTDLDFNAHLLVELLQAFCLLLPVVLQRIVGRLQLLLHVEDGVGLRSSVGFV